MLNTSTIVGSLGFTHKTSTLEVILEDKNTVEQMRLIQQLEEDHKQTIFKLIDKMLTNKKFKDFFAKNVYAL